MPEYAPYLSAEKEAELVQIANRIVAKGHGILASDESTRLLLSFFFFFFFYESHVLLPQVRSSQVPKFPSSEVTLSKLFNYK